MFLTGDTLFPALGKAHQELIKGKATLEIVAAYMQGLWQNEETNPAPEWIVFDVFINKDTPILTAVKREGEWYSDGNMIGVAMWRERPPAPDDPPTLW